MSCSGFEYFVLVCLAIFVYKAVDRLCRWPYVRRVQARYIFITGCDTGFGHELAKRLDRKRCFVFAGCLTELGETILKKQTAYKLKTLRLDVADLDSIRQAYEYVKDQIPEGKGLWALVNNAGIAGKLGPAEWLTRADYQQVLDVNLHGMVAMTTTFLPLIKRAGGRVVNTASFLGRLSVPGAAPYCVSKFAVEAFSDLLRRELKKWGCSVHIVEPGTFKTPLAKPSHLTNMLQNSWESLPQEMREEYGEEFIQKTAETVYTQGISLFGSSRLSAVAEVYEHAALAVWPRARYVVGVDARYLWIPLSRLPDWISDLAFDVASLALPKPAALNRKL